MNLPTYKAIEAMIRLDQSQPVSTEQWKMRMFYTTIDTVKMMNKGNAVEKEAKDERDK